MITKGIILDRKDNLYKVRIPIYHGIANSANFTKDEDLPYISANVIPGLITPFEKDDIVFISFEEEELSKPIIIGNLHLLTNTDRTESTLQLSHLKVNKTIKLSEQTSIGNVTSTNISHLKGTNKNIQEQFNNILNTDSIFTSQYLQDEFNQNLKWVLNDRGLILTGKFLDNNNDQLNTLNYTIPTIAEEKVVDSTSYTSYIDNTTPGGPYTVYYSDGSNKDRRLRLNWQGSSIVKNDKVKIQSGLYARNNWKLFPLLVGDKYLAQPEYTWRPTIQGSTNEQNLRLVQSLDTEDDQNSENQLYFNDWYPYYLMLNPDGGDIEFGRGGKVVIYDNDNNLGTPTEGIKLKGSDGTTILLKAESGKLTSNGGSIGGGGSGSAVFTYFSKGLGFVLITSQNFESLKIKIGETICYQKVNEDYIQVSPTPSTQSGYYGYYFEDKDQTFISPWIPHYDTTYEDTGIRTFIKKGLYDQYVKNGNESNFRSGYISVKASITLGVGTGTETIYYLPLCMEQLIQLDTLLTLNSGIPIRFDLSKMVSIAWDNLDFHFQIEVTASLDKESDTLSITVKNINNFITVMNLTQDNIISIYKARLAGPRDGPNGGASAPAAINISILYQGNDIEEAVDLSEIIDYGQDEVIE